MSPTFVERLASFNFSFHRSLFKFILVTHLLLLMIGVTRWTTEALSMEESNEFMNGKVLRVLVFNYPPSMIITRLPDGTMQYRGVAFEMLGYFAKALNISYEYVFLQAEAVKRLGGNGPAQVEAIADGQADLAPCGTIPSHFKYQQNDLTIPWAFQSIEIVVPFPEEDMQYLIAKIIHPFQPIVWLYLGVSVVVLAFVLTFLTNLYEKYIEIPSRLDEQLSRDQPSISLMNLDSLGRNTMFIWSHLTNHCYFIRLNSRRAVLILVGVWCLMTVVLAHAYGRTLFSFLSVTKLGPVINSIDELARSDNIEVIVQGGTDTVDRFLNSNAKGTEKRMGDSLRRHPENVIDKFNPEALKQKMMTGPFATIHLEIITRRIIDSTYRQNGNKCKYTLAKEKFESFNPIVSLLRKNSPYTNAINKQIEKLIDAGLLDYMIKQYVPRIDQCKMKNQKPDTRYRSLSLRNMSTAFVVLSIGIGLATLVFMSEKLYYKWILVQSQQPKLEEIKNDEAKVIITSALSKENDAPDNKSNPDGKKPQSIEKNSIVTPTNEVVIKKLESNAPKKDVLIVTDIEIYEEVHKEAGSITDEKVEADGKESETIIQASVEALEEHLK